MLVASIAGKLSGVPIPSNVPLLGKMGPALQRFSALIDDNEGQLKKVQKVVDALQVKIKEGKQQKESMETIRIALADSYNTLKQMLEGPCLADWQKFKQSGVMQKVYSPKGTVHWVAKRHMHELKEQNIANLA